MPIDKWILEGSGESVDLRGENDQAGFEYLDGTEGSGLPPCDISGKVKYNLRSLQSYYIDTLSLYSLIFLFYS